ncbi:pduH protein [Mycobacterium sp. NS-7484]|uniref:glycerol dehydratase reactivase beta/small subunit family protein n=1 Tax=Mycobacterium sp. NS-7484 TaxID=1834161 RepID=UPI00096CE9A3|nr:glycerol dehydratase reactivase beta/small subunit family protein [Mycobacterium sp. NS-7484]OMC00155.1 pduH protein [Mycobacterium sp. NS-7484]
MSSGEGEVERQVLAGIEEEGVPYAVLPGADAVSAPELALRAAQRSPLQVGVGVTAVGEVSVRHAKLADPLPELSSGSGIDATTARILGHNAARIVVGLPLKPDD